MKIAIIGTAGRKEDGPKLSKELYEKMVQDAHDIIYLPPHQLAMRGDISEGVTLVSGGAAWSDHIAVSLYLMDEVPYLTLYFPCKWNQEKKCFIGEDIKDETNHVNYNSSTAQTANYYYKLFSKKVSHNTLSGIQQAIDKGATYHEIQGGFLARNLLVGQVDAIIAYSFGEGSRPKDGGTSHTWDHSNAPIKIHRPIGEL